MTAYPLRRRTVPEGTVLFVASFGGFLAFLDATIVNVAIPDIGRSFEGSGLDSISWVLNAYNIVFAAFLVAAGRLVDLLGRKRMFEIGVVVFTLASLLCGLAPSLGFLIGARMLQAVGAAIIVPASLALIIHAFSAERRTHGVSLYTAVSALAAGLGPATGGALIEIADWRWCFLVNLPIGIAAVVLSRRSLVESRAPGRRNVPDLFGALVLAFAIGALTFAIVKTDTWSLVDARVLGPIIASVALLAYFLRRCAWHPAPIVNLALLRIKDFATANLLTVIGGAGFYSYILCNVLFLTSIWGYNALEAGLALTPGPFIAAAVAGPLGRMMIGRDPRFILVPGALIWAGGLLWMITQVGPEPAFLSEWLPGMFILGIGAGITFPTLGGVAVAAAPGGAYATSTALSFVARQFGATLGISLLVAIIGTPTTTQGALDAFDNGWTFALVGFLLVAAGIFVLGRVVASAEAAEEVGAIDARAAALTLAGEPAAPVALATAEESLPESGDVESFLAGVEVFKGLDRERLAKIAAGAKDRLLLGDATLFEAGDPADALFVVRSGRIEVVGPGGEIYRELGPGDVLGELAVLAGTTRSAAVRARRDSLLLELPWEHVGGLLESDVEFSKAMIGVLARQLQASRGVGSDAVPLPRLVAAVPLHPGIDMADFGDQLGRALASHRRVFVMRDDGRPAADRAAYVEAVERDHDVVVLVGDEPGSEWTDFCAREADRVLALTGEGPAPGYEPALALKGCTLLCGGDFADKQLTPWFPLLEAKTSHRIPSGAGEAPAIAALARRLTGTSVGLVLSGGGARGFAHIGVLDVLQQAGILIDRVAGTSMGAYIGGLYASGHDPDQIDSICYEEWVRRNPLNDYRFPRTSLIRGEKVRAMFDRSFSGDIEQMPRSFFCCAVDLVSGALVVHRYGHAAFGIATSMTLPALAPPAATGAGALLVDGGLRNNMPVDLMAAENEGPIIAVDVGAESGMRLARLEPDELGLNGDANGEVLAWDEDKRVITPTLGELLVRAVTLGSADGAALAAKHASILIEPADDGVGMLEFHMLDVMRASGRTAARAALQGSAPAAT